MSLAEKALVSCGMGPAVWLLVQLHQAHAFSFYQLPSQSATAVADPHAKGSCAGPISSPTVARTSSRGLASASGDVSKARATKDGAEEVGQVEKSTGEGPLGGQPYSTVMLIGTSVDVAIIVVLSWAAQLVQLGVTSVMMQDDNITFELGELLVNLLSTQLARLWCSEIESPFSAHVQQLRCETAL